MKKTLSVFYISCKSGYWSGLSHVHNSHMYTQNLDEAAKFFNRTEAEKMKCWYDETPLSYMRIKAPLEPFEVVEKNYIEI